MQDEKGTQSAVAVTVDTKVFKPVTKFKFNHDAGSVPEAIGMHPADTHNAAVDRILDKLRAEQGMPPTTPSKWIEVYFNNCTQEELEAVAIIGLLKCMQG